MLVRLGTIDYLVLEVALTQQKVMRANGTYEPDTNNSLHRVLDLVTERTRRQNQKMEKTTTQASEAINKFLLK